MFRRIFRRTYRRYRRLMFVAVGVYLITCLLLLMTLQDSSGSFGPSQFFVKIYDPFGSAIERRCSLRNRARVIATPWDEITQTHVASIHDKENRSVCYSPDAGHDVDLQMEDVWDSVSVGYPNLVLTVTGWVDTIQVESYTPKPLRVIVMPHSHQDPGWTSTVESYYNSYTRPTLDLVVDKLTANPSWKFIWTEIIFLDMWWTSASDERKQRFKRLLDNGQLELLTGGWVMTDEATAHYGAMLDQLMEGQIWVKQTLNKTVMNSWAIDPFGHSSTMTYLIGQSGIRNVVIQRVHFAIKRRFATSRNLEFYWQQQWDNRGDTGVFCHVMPFLLYGIPFSCGPDRHVCCKFDFHKKNCFYGNKHVKTVNLTEANIAQLASELWEQLQKKSELYRSDVVLMPHGDDFRYNENAEWDEQFTNLKKLMDHINNNTVMNMKIEFGTLADYFNALHESSKGPQHEYYPTLKGDFMSYSDRGDQYWSGIYTSRPFYKYMARKLQSALRSAEILFTLSLSKMSVNTSMTSLYQKLESARRALALHQHHDAITGTSRQSVVNDYGVRLHRAIQEAALVQTLSVQSILKKHFPVTAKDHTIVVNLTESYPSYNKLPEHVLLTPHHPIILAVSNQLGHHRHEIVHVVVNASNVCVTDGLARVVGHQISPIWTDQKTIDERQFLLSFDVDVEPLSLTSFTITVNTSMSKRDLAKVSYVTQTRDVFAGMGYQNGPGPFHALHVVKPALEYSNSYLTATFSACDGMLKLLRYHGINEEYKSDVHFVTYSTDVKTHPFRDKSGAYIFLPDGVAKELPQETPLIVVTEGNVFIQIRTIYKDIVHIATIYNITGPLGMGVHLENVIHISSNDWNNRELVMRVETNIRDDQHSFCTDLNGFQMHRRKTRSKMHIQGNFYPMTTMALLDDDDTRFTLITTETHGVASLVSGWLDVVLDRRLIQDDWRGLNEGVKDNIRTKSSFFLMFERRIAIQKVQSSKYTCLPSTVSDFLSESLNNPLSVFTTTPNPPKTSPLSHSPNISPQSPDHVTLAPQLQCGLHIINFRMLPVRDTTLVKEALIVLHNRGLDCGVKHSDADCAVKSDYSMSEILVSLDLASVTEMDITGVTEQKLLKINDKINIKPMHIKTFKVSFR